MIISCNTFLPTDRAQATSGDFGITVKLNSATVKVTDVVVEAILTTVSFDSNTDVSLLKFLYYFFDICFLSF